MVLDAVRPGIGAGLLPISLVSRDLRDGRLVQLGDAADPPVTLWALYPSRRLSSARVSSFIDHLVETFPVGTPEDLAAYIARQDVAVRAGWRTEPGRCDRVAAGLELCCPSPGACQAEEE